MTDEQLHELYNTDIAVCSVCGCFLESACGAPLGSIFVLDKNGHYYCMNCDSKFENGDENIYDE